PHKILWRTCRTWSQVAKGITEMVVRGAPAIGCVAAYGVVLAALARRFKSVEEARRELSIASEGLLKARPTAVNLRWALDRMRKIWDAPGISLKDLAKELQIEAGEIETEDRAANQAMGEHGAALVPAGATLLTICNTGSLA